MIARANGQPVSITGLGCHVPERVLDNGELERLVDTSDEWIMERTGIRERRIAAPEEALSDLALPAAREALAQAGVDGKDIDLLICATVTPDMAFPATAALLADQLGSSEAAAYDLSAGCTGFMYAIAQAYGMLAGGLVNRALVVGGECGSHYGLNSQNREIVGAHKLTADSFRLIPGSQTQGGVDVGDHSGKNIVMIA